MPRGWFRLLGIDRFTKRTRIEKISTIGCCEDVGGRVDETRRRDIIAGQGKDGHAQLLRAFRELGDLRG